MKRLLALPLIAALAAAAGTPEPGSTLAVDVALANGKVHEACARLDKGEKRRYHWKSTAPLDFNIHYHEGNEVFYPVKRAGMRGDGGTFVAKIAQDYCWMWTARGADATVTGEIRP